jgi:hypothetical protein
MSKPKFDPNKPFEMAQAAPKPKFDPNAGFEPMMSEIERPETDLGSAVFRGTAQGISANFIDEATAGVGAAKDYLAGKLGLRGDFDIEQFPEVYESYLRGIRKKDAEAQEDHPVGFGIGQVGGALATTALVPALNPAAAATAAGRVGVAAGTGAVAAAGASEANPFKGEEEALRFAADTGLGAGIGAVAQYGFDKAAPAISKGLGKAVDATKTAAGKVAPKVARVLTNVEEADLAKYMANPERINKAPSTEAIKDTIDDLVGRIAGDRDAAATALEKARGGLDDAYKFRLADLRNKSVPSQYADELVGALENEKQTLGSLGEQAYDALARTEGTVSKQHLLDFIDQVGGSVGVGKNKVIVGDKANEAVQKLWKMRERLSALDDEIPYTDLKDILKQIDPDINWRYGAGEFNSVEDRLKKEFRGGLSKVLKDKSPEYAGYMERMSELADNLGEMSKYFGSREKALAALETIATQRGPRATALEESLKRFARNTGNSDLYAKIDEFKGAKALLSDAKLRDLRELVAPDEFRAVAEKEAALQAAQAKLDPVARLRDTRTQGVIRNQGFKNASIEDRRALEALSEQTGIPVLQLIEDRNVLDAFSKDATNGARRTMLGTVLGGAAGLATGNPIVGPAVGAAAGAAVDKYGPAMTKKVADAVLKAKSAGSQFAAGARNVSAPAAMSPITPGPGFAEVLQTGSGRAVSRMAPGAVLKEAEAVGPKIGEMLRTNPAVFGRYAGQLQQAAARGNHALAVTHFLLAQQDPEYRKVVAPGDDD